MRRIMSAALAAAAVATTAVSAAAAPDVAPKQTVALGPCPTGIAGPGIQCSTLQVPLDYRNPHGRTITVAFDRLASAKPAQRRGVLLLNPGGPGLSGMAALTVLAKQLPQQVRDSYDVIGMDPRGVGRSTPATCDMTPTQRKLGLSVPYPQNSADVARQAVAAKAVARQCTSSKTGPLLPFMTTANTARDMDRLRAALGAPTLSYYGLSYGTYLGAVYTTLFPQRSDRIVLDSSLGPEGYDINALRLQGLGFQTTFPDFARYAAAHPGYGLGATPAAVTATYYRLAARLDRHPTPGVDGTIFRAAVIGSLYENDLKGLAEFWQLVDTNQPIPPAAPPASDNIPASYLNVVCGDSRWPRAVSTYQRNVLVDRIRYPMYGASSANIRPCAFWPNPVAPPVRITDRGPSDVLLVQNLRDPGTPLPEALRMRAALGGRARMVTVDQERHGVYFGANACGRDAVTDYLVTGHRPATDTFCRAE